MKFDVFVSRDTSLKVVDYVYTFGDFPTIVDFMNMPDPLMSSVRMERFDDTILESLFISLANASSSFKRPGYYTKVTLEEDDLLYPGPAVTICIKVTS